MLKTLLLGFAFMLFASTLLAVYVYVPETYEVLATDAATVTTYVKEVVDEHIPEKAITFEDALQEPVKEDTLSLTLASLLSTTSSYHCTVSLVEGEARQGTMLVGNGNVHAVFNREIENRTTQTHVIKNADGIYVWNEGLDGLYFKTVEEADVLSDTRELTYTCRAQTLSSASFKLPEGLTFYTK